MATKKQKREAALARREQFLKDERERGLAAQKAARAEEEEERAASRAMAEEINARHRAILLPHARRL